jgi:hypothetical protein
MATNWLACWVLRVEAAGIAVCADDRRVSRLKFLLSRGWRRRESLYKGVASKKQLRRPEARRVTKRSPVGEREWRRRESNP